MHKVHFAQLFPQANPDALDLLDRMLAFDPSSRITVEQALEHRYLQIWHDVSDEPNCPTKFDFGFEVVEDVPSMRQMILDEVQRFRHKVRTPQAMMPTQGPSSQQQQQSGAVPMPQGRAEQWRKEDPRPQETQGVQQAGHMDLERELEGGLDAMHG